MGEVAARVDRRLEELLAGELARWADVDPDLAAPFGALRDYVLAGGKRLRPSFCFWSFVGAGGDPADERIIDAGAALEMLHSAALVHDDIIDGSRLRHGADTVHVRFDGLHRRLGWSGDPAAFGQAAAIIIGDLALVYSSRLIGAASPAALGVFEEMRLEVNVGQYLDVLGAALGVSGDPMASAERARRICRYKTAKYTIERPLHLGAALAGEEQLRRLAAPLSKLGLPLGEAFQLKDDLLGVFGDPSVTGKPVGDDLREGKPTLLASLAAAQSSGADLLARRFGAADLTTGEVTAMQDAIEAGGARAAVEKEIDELLAASDAALEDLDLTAPAVAALRQIATYLAGRDR